MRSRQSAPTTILALSLRGCHYLFLLPEMLVLAIAVEHGANCMLERFAVTSSAPAGIGVVIGIDI